MRPAPVRSLRPAPPDESRSGLQAHHQPAADRLPDEGGPRESRAPLARVLAERRDLREAARGRPRPSARSSWPTARRTPTAPSTSVTRSTRSSRTSSSSRARSTATTRRTCRAGTATGCRSSTRSRRPRPRRRQARREGVPRRVPRVRGQAGRQRNASDFMRLGVLRRLGQPLPDDAARATRRRSAGLRAHLRARPHLQGLKPVHWCLDCRSALAEAEVEYEERTRPSIDVRFAVRRPGRPRAARPASTPATCRRRVSDLDDHALDAAGQPGGRRAPRARRTRCVRAEGPAGRRALVRRDRARRRRSSRAAAAAPPTSRAPQGRGARGAAAPPPVLRPRGAGDPRRARDARGRYRRACTPRPATVWRTTSSASATGCRSDNPVGGDGRFVAVDAAVRRHAGRRGQSQVVEVLAAAGRLLSHAPYRHSYPHCWRHKTPVIFRATPQWFISMEKEGLRAQTLRDDPSGAVDARLGREAHLRHDREPPGLVHLAPAHLGRADPVVPAHARAARCIRARSSSSTPSRRVVETGRHRRLVRPRAARSCSAPRPPTTRSRPT